MQTSVPGDEDDDAQAGSMDAELSRPRPDTFIVRLANRNDGELAGMIQHVRSRARQRFEGLAGLGEAIQALTRDGQSDPGE